jgi:hypothetical protein
MKSKSKFTISRRAMLRGIVGGSVATVALPVFEAMLNSNGTALAGGAPIPKRYLTYMFGNGVLLPRWVPATTGSSWALTEQLMPLAPVKAYVNVLSGFANRIPAITHHEGMAGMWSGYEYIFTDPDNPSLNTYFGGPSIDQIAADYLRALWDLLFNTGAADDPTRPHRVNVLDVVKSDIDRLKAKLGQFDRDRLDSHLTSVEELQTQIGTLQGTCSPIAEPTETNTAQNPEPMVATAAAMNALLVHAFSCDLSRVASYMLTGGVGSTVYSHLGQSATQHNLTHMFPSQTVNDQISDGIVWNMEQFSNLLQAMAAVNEGATNLLDNSIVVLGSDHAEGYAHSNEDMPVLVCGGGGGTLVNPGIHVRATGNRNLSDVLLSTLQAVDPSITSVGGGVGLSTTPVTEILT